MSNWTDNSSIVGHIGGYGDKILNPLSWVTHGKWTHLTSDVLPEKVNAGLSSVMKPFDKVDKTINPVRKIPIVNRVGDIVANKPGDALAIAAGAYFGGMAALGGGAGGAGGAGAEGGALGTTSGFGGVGMDAGATGVVPGELGGAGLGAEGGAGAAGDFTFNAAQDSQLANVENGLEPVTTDDTIPSAGSESGKSDYMKRAQQAGKAMQNSAQQRQREIDASRVNVDSPQLQNPYAVSSKAMKTAASAGAAQAIAKGAEGCDPIDANGVQAAAIQEISKRLTAAKSRLAELMKEEQ